MGGVYSTSSMDPFPESGWGLGLLCLTCSWIISFCLWGRGSPSEGSSFLSLYWRAIHPGDAQYQCLFGLFHPFLCPALLWLEGHGGFHYFTIRVILLGGGDPWMNHLYFWFQWNWWCFMHLQAWQFLGGCGVRGDLGGSPLGGGMQLFAPWGFCLSPCQGMLVGLQTPGEGRF